MPLDQEFKYPEFNSGDPVTSKKYGGRLVFSNYETQYGTRWGVTKGSGWYHQNDLISDLSREGYTRYVVHIHGERAEQYTRRQGSWVIANIEQTVSWPDHNLVVEFEGELLVLLGYGDGTYMPAVAMISTEHRAKEFIPRFLSYLNYTLCGSVRIDSWFGGSSIIRSRISKDTMKYLTKEFRIWYLPQNLSRNANLALALFREGDSLKYHHYGYSFLSFYKIINIVDSDGEAQKAWMSSHLSKVDKEATKRREELISEGNDVSSYLYHSCRCALAHAGLEPTINPDDINQYFQLYKDLPLVRSLASILIREHFGIQTVQDVHNKHLYELFGIKRVVSANVVKKLASRDFVNKDDFILEIAVSLRQWPDKKYGVFEGLATQVISIRDGVVILRCYSPGEVFTIDLVLDFPEESFTLKLDRAAINTADHKLEAKCLVDFYKFYRDWICNGQLEIWDSNKEVNLGAKLSHIPVNIEPGQTCINMNRLIAELEGKNL